jgi:hypothetical protein
MHLFYKDATETITIIKEDGKKQVVDGCGIYNSKNKIVIKNHKLENNDILSVSVEVGDIIEHTTKAGTTERYEVNAVDYLNRSVHGHPKLNCISLKVQNIKTKPKPTNPNVYNISGVSGSNISIQSPHSNQSIQIMDEIKKDPEIEEKLKELEEAIKNKDKNKFQYILGILLDKGFDVGVGLLLAKLTGQI